MALGKVAQLYTTRTGARHDCGKPARLRTFSNATVVRARGMFGYCSQVTAKGEALNSEKDLDKIEP